MNSRSLLWALMPGLLCVAPLAAQQFGPPGPDNLPIGDFVTPIGVVDFDGDGAPDLIDSTPEFWRNDGRGVFSAPVSIGSRFHAYRFLSADFDNNGTTDFAWYGPGTTPLLQLQFNGRLVDYSVSPLLYAEEILAGDVDGDGDRDLVCLSQLASQTGIYLYQPGGRFVRSSAAGFPASHSQSDNPRSAGLADFDSDGDLDLLLVLVDRIELWTNDGRGRFGEAQELRVSSWNAGPLRCEDLDGDGDIDSLLVSHSSQITVLENDGTGRLAVRPSGAPSRNREPWDVDLADIDNDGDLDLVIAQEDLVAYINDGSGRFPTLRTVLAGWVRGQQAFFADFDGDGRIDLFVDRGPRLYLQSARGDFVPAGGASIPRADSARTRYLSADFNGDGNLDLFNNAGGRGQLLFGDGRQRFQDVSMNLPGSHTLMLGIAAGDLDGDGDIDLVTSANGGPNRTLINDGTGRFRERRTSMSTSFDTVPAIDLADLDGDGMPEVISVGQFRGVRIWKNRLPTDIVEDPLALPERILNAVSIECADLDNDGDIDLLVGLQGSTHPPMPGRIRRFDNDGSGRFRERPNFPPVTMGPVDTFDFDLDGDLDLVAGNRVWVNDGAGNFSLASASQVPPLPMNDQPTALADIDGDGHPDLVTTAGGGRALHNDGNGGFRDITANWMTSRFGQMSLGLAADVDADGDADMVMIGEYGDELWASRTRDLRIAALPIGGDTLSWEISAYGMNGANALLAFSVGVDSPQVLPGLGTLRLDTSAWIPGIQVPLSSTRPTVVTTSVPSDPSLVGLRLDTQALIGSTAANLRLSNAAETHILR